MRFSYALWFFLIAGAFAFYKIFPPPSATGGNNPKAYIIPEYKKADGSAIELYRNPSAMDVSWAHVQQFLQMDSTEQKNYVPNVYTCAHFAEDLFNRAQSAGIQAGFVSIDFEGKAEGHAINAFRTTDKGIVFIDATGIVTSDVSAPAVKSVGYLEEGKSYFSIPLHVKLAREYPSVYSAGQFYLKETQRLAEQAEVFESKAQAFNQRIQDFNQKQNDLNALRTEYFEKQKRGLDRRLTSNEQLSLERQANHIAREQYRLEEERELLAWEQKVLERNSENIQQRRDQLQWYSKSTDKPVSKVTIHW